MKNTMMCLAFLLSFLAAYLLTTIGAWLLNDMTFKAVASSEYHIIGCMFVYWWLPGFFVLSDVEQYYKKMEGTEPSRGVHTW